MKNWYDNRAGYSVNNSDVDSSSSEFLQKRMYIFEIARGLGPDIVCKSIQFKALWDPFLFMMIHNMDVLFGRNQSCSLC